MQAIRERMTLADYEAICRLWLIEPPAHLLIAAYVGYRPPDTTPPGTFEDFLAWAGVGPNAGGG